MFKKYSGWLFDKPEIDWITIGLTIVRRDRRDDDEDQIDDGKNPQQQDADQDENEDDAYNRGNRDRDLEVQRFLALIIHERHFILLDLPDDQRADDRTERDQVTDQG